MEELLMARQIGTNRDAGLRRATIARLDPRGPATVRCISIVAFIWCFGCVRGSRGHIEQDWPTTLQVAHVVSEQDFLAGFPVGAYRVVTDRRSTNPFGAVVVDGFPMCVGTAGLDPAAERENPWCLVVGGGLRASPNQLEPQQGLRAGDDVLLGGYFQPRDGLTPVDYAELPSSVITGRLLAIPPAGVSESPLHWVLVPPGDYNSFLGGPAASQSDSEGIRVWGVVAQVVPLPHGPWSLGALLGVAKLSPSFSSSAVGEIRR